MSRPGLLLRICISGMVLFGTGRRAAAQAGGSPTVISMRVADTTIAAKVNDSPSSRDFLRLLPMTITMQRYGDREYYGKPGVAISVEGQRQNHFTNGDLAYWAPGGSLAVFFAREGQSSISDLIVMGKVTSDLTVLERLGQSIEVTIDITKGNGE